VADLALFKDCAFQMIKVRAAIPAGVMDIGVAVGSFETVASQLLALADDAPASA
jgi:hypothetical protein